MTFVEVMVVVRRRRGLSQEQLGAMLGVDRTYVNKIEREKAQCSRWLLHSIATILDDPELWALAPKVERHAVVQGGNRSQGSRPG